MLAANCRARNSAGEPHRVAALYDQYLALKQQADEVRAARNQNASSMKANLEPGARAALVEQGKQLKEQLADLEARLLTVSPACAADRAAPVLIHGTPLVSATRSPAVWHGD